MGSSVLVSWCKQAAAQALDQARVKLRKNEATCRLVDASVVMTKLLVRAGGKKLDTLVDQFENSCHGTKQAVENALREKVEAAARDLQTVIAFHEERKKKADTQIAQRNRGERRVKWLLIVPTNSYNLFLTNSFNLLFILALLQSCESIRNSLVKRLPRRTSDWRSEYRRTILVAFVFQIIMDVVFLALMQLHCRVDPGEILK